MEFNKLGNGLSSQTRDVYVLTLQWHLKALPCPTYSSGIFRFLQPPVYPELKTRHSVLDLVVVCLDQTSMCHVVDMFSRKSSHSAYGFHEESVYSVWTA